MSDFEEDIIPFADVGECRPRLRRTLLQGGLARWFDGKQTRLLDSTRAVQSLARLPWPLSMIQPQFIQFAIFDGAEIVQATPVFEHTFKKSEMEQAIDAFLQGSSPTDCVQFTII